MASLSFCSGGSDTKTHGNRSPARVYQRKAGRPTSQAESIFSGHAAYLDVRGLAKRHEGPWSLGQLTGGLFFGEAAAASAPSKRAEFESTQDLRANLSGRHPWLGIGYPRLMSSSRTRSNTNSRTTSTPS